MATTDPLHVLTGPFGIALVLLGGLGVTWRILRRLPADRRRRRVRIALAIVLLAALGWTWGRPQRPGPSRLLLGRHAWLEVRDTTDLATGAARTSARMVGPNLVASVLESVVAVALVIGADLGIARRLGPRDERHCPRCGYPRPDPHATTPRADGRRDHGAGLDATPVAVDPAAAKAAAVADDVARVDAHAAHGDVRAGGTSVDAADRRCPECGLNLTAGGTGTSVAAESSRAARPSPSSLPP